MGCDLLSQLVEKIRPNIEKIISDLDLYLIDIKFLNRNSENYLEIYIDNKGGLTMDECEEATRAINEYLDEEDPIQKSYSLIVSSPGLDRPLETDLDFYLALDEELEINFYQPYKGQKKIFAILKAYDDDSFEVVDDQGNNIILDRSLVSKMQKAIRI